MISSMTAFSRQDNSGEWGRLTWEIRSVNHRYLDLSFKLPDHLRALEPQLRQRLKERFARGRVECSLRHSNASSRGASAELIEWASRFQGTQRGGRGAL